MLIMTLKNYRFIFLFLIISTLTSNAFALDLSSAITSSSNRVQSGASVTYTGTVINNSSTSATNSQLIFYMPPRNVNYISLPVGCTIKIKITCLLGDLVGGASVSKSITVSYSSSGAAIVGALAVTESADSNINNNASRLITNVTKSSTNSVTIPLISSVNPSPVSVTLGNSINFSASLSGNLPSGYSVKLNYSNSSISMSGSGTSFSTVQAPTQIGQQIFSVGIYDANNILKSNSMTGNFEIVKANTFPTLSFMSGNTTATVGASYSVQLQGNDSDNNLSLITINWGDGSSNSQNASNGSTLTFSHTYSSANSFTWSATAIDSANASSSAVSKTVSVSAAVVTPPVNNPSSGTGKLNDTGITTCSNAVSNNLPCPVSGVPNQDAQSGRDVTNNDDSDGHAGFSFTKINSTGASLPASATNWNCVKDNVTGLMWEVKTTDGGLHDQNHTYTWYESDNTKNGGAAGTQNGGSCKGSQCDTNAYVTAVNSVGYCDYKDWRLPTVDELLSIVSLDIYNPAIDINYFPNTRNYVFWSSSPYAVSSVNAWSVFFSYGYSYSHVKGNNNHVRLVRG